MGELHAIDVLLLLLIVSAVILAVRSRMRIKNGGCSSCCSGCSSETCRSIGQRKETEEENGDT